VGKFRDRKIGIEIEKMREVGVTRKILVDRSGSKYIEENTQSERLPSLKWQKGLRKFLNKVTRE
jgi:hypothetical protein